MDDPSAFTKTIFVYAYYDPYPQTSALTADFLIAIFNISTLDHKVDLESILQHVDVKLTVLIKSSIWQRQIIGASKHVL